MISIGCEREGPFTVQLGFEVFRPALTKAVKRSDGSKGGCPPFDAALMFKALVLQTLYTLSDEATEFQLRGRLSFIRFLGLGLQDPVPDATTGEAAPRWTTARDQTMPFGPRPPNVRLTVSSSESRHSAFVKSFGRR